MPLTNAEKQARHRAKQSGLIERLQAEVIALRAEVAALRGAARTVIDHSAIHGDRVWRLAGEREHVTKAGRRVFAAVWETPCVVCGVAFQIGTKLGATTGHEFNRVTCEAHRMSASERATVAFTGRSRRRAAFEAIKAAKLQKEAVGAAGGGQGAEGARRKVK